jgi:indolepyruvate ferredoxin oxidoreductase beta subunit
MGEYTSQKIIISGVGGQGILFVTRLLAEAAIIKELSVLTSETHGMAQRGGTVLSHLKVGSFSSPLIRPFQADMLLALKKESLNQHGFYLKSNAWAVVNTANHVTFEADWSVYTIDADKLALDIKSPKSVNLVLLGFALAVASEYLENKFFCSLEDIKTLLENRLKDKQKVAAIKAIEIGYYLKSA